METTFTDCPLFTARHAHHSVVWCIPGVSLPTLCIACATERLENKGELGIHVKKVLGELQALLDSSSGKLLEILNTDRRVTEHLCGLLFSKWKMWFDSLLPLWRLAKNMSVCIFTFVCFFNVCTICTFRFDSFPRCVSCSVFHRL